MKRKISIASLSTLIAGLVAGSTAHAQPTALTQISSGVAGFGSSNAAASLSGDGSMIVLNLAPVPANETGAKVYLFQPPGTYTLVSRSALSGGPASGTAEGGEISSDGHLIMYVSNASDITSGDTNSNNDVFLFDNSGTLPVTTAITNTTENHSISDAHMSRNGRYVAYLKQIPMPPSTFIYLYDKQLASTTSVTGTSADRPLGVSNNGQILILTPDPITGIDRLVLKDVPHNQSTFVDQTSSAPDKSAIWGAISADGNFVVFNSRATNLVAGDTNRKTDVFLKDLRSGVIKRISTSVDGKEANQGCDKTKQLAISDDGNISIFGCRASTLIFEDNNVYSDIFAYDNSSGALTALSTTTAGVFGNDDSSAPAVSGDGRFVTFASYATNFFAGDTLATPDDFLVATGAPLSIDQCPTDSTKTAPGACGCGMSDADANNNGVPDCNDPGARTVPSSAPALKPSAGKLSVVLPDVTLPGTSYIVTVSKGRKALFRRTVADNLTTFKLPPGLYAVSYRFLLANGISSQASPPSAVRVKED